MATKQPTGKEIAAYLLTLDHKRQLESQARNLGKLLAIQEEPLVAYVEAETKGRRVQAVEVSGYRLELVPKPKSVAWAKEFVRECGAELAERIKQAAGTVKKFTATPVTARAATAAQKPAA